jgi:hypothetical protein
VAKLVVNIGVLPANFGENPVRFACSAEDAVRFASFVGQEVLVAIALAEGQPLTIAATAQLAKFSPAETPPTATLNNLRLLTSEFSLPYVREAAQFFFLEDADFNFFQTDSGVLRNHLEEARSPFLALDIYAEIARQVRRQNNSICGFSGVPVEAEEGLAMPIVPLESGGRAHARNFIFLHDEPAHLFNQFAWTIGPDLEIIMDCRAIGTDVLSTINLSGKLVVSRNQDAWPDEQALAWHRQRFFERLR